MRLNISTKARIIFAVAVLFLLASLTPAGISQAAVGGCRSDPAVLLSNGHTVHLDSWINTDASNVTSLTYNLSIPHGTSVVSITDNSQLASVTFVNVTAFNAVNI